MSQPREALALANEIRLQGVRERRELVGAPIQQVVNALIHPSKALGAMRLKHLLTPRTNSTGPIPRCGPVTLDRALAELAETFPLGRRFWSPELRLRELTEAERRRLVRVLIREAPESWRNAA